MFDFLYTIIIFPLVQLIEITFMIIFRIFGDSALAIIGVSAVVTICTMPLYFIAEKWQQTERDIQKLFKSKIEKIKSVFKGDEQYMVLSAFYKQNHYHPVYAMRTSISILIQIPFFLAAYFFLSNLGMIKDVPFFFIKDLGAPDKFLTIDKFSVNILPIIMTLINCISGVIYTKGLDRREKIQIYGMALIFFILLYNSPSGLVLYWTMNNIFSLFRNIIKKTGHGLIIVYGILCFCVLYIYRHYLPLGFSPKRLFVTGFCSLIFFAPLITKLYRYYKKKISAIYNLEHSSLAAGNTFIFSAFILCILSGLVIPGSLIAASVQEFSFLESYTTPLPFLYTSFIQSVGIFLFWPICIYFLFPKNIKYGLTLFLSLLCVAALVNTFLFPGDYGSITTTFKFSNPDTFESKYKIVILSSLVTFGIFAGFTLLLLSKRKFIFYSFQLIILVSLSLFGLFNIYKINRDFNNYKILLTEYKKYNAELEEPSPVYYFSRNSKNVVLFFLDAAVSGYFPYIMQEKPELFKYYSGFTYYPNCISFGYHTRTGAPTVYGGYEYEPRYIQKNRSIALEHHNQALLLLPLLFKKEDYRVTVTDPSLANYSVMADLSIFDPYPGINAQNTQGAYTGMWLRSHPEINVVSVPDLLRELLIRFSLLKTVFPAFRVFFYDKALWLKPPGVLLKNQLSLEILDNYSALDYLPLITGITEDMQNTYTAIVNDLPHDSVILQYPDYIPAMEITNSGTGPFTEKSNYHVNIAAIMLVGKWLNFLQEQGVYNNIRIIIVSDHGHDVKNEYSGNHLLLSGQYLSRFHSLFLVKDFNAEGELITDNTFMTTGDVPAIIMKDLIENPRNPFSGLPIKTDKDNGVFIATSSALQYTIKDDQWLYVHDDIFKSENWKKQTPPFDK